MATPASEAITRLRKRKLEIVRQYKAARGCGECGEDDVRCLDLHHRDPADKSRKLYRRTQGSRTGGSRWGDLSYAALAEELEKCDVLCANCHRKLTVQLPCLESPQAP